MRRVSFKVKKFVLGVCDLLHEVSIRDAGETVNEPVLTRDKDPS
jgi:hypothetical protein